MFMFYKTSVVIMWDREEDKLRKELQQALTQESSICRDQLHQASRHQVCQEEYANEVIHTRD